MNEALSALHFYVSGAYKWTKKSVSRPQERSTAWAHQAADEQSKQPRRRL